MSKYVSTRRQSSVPNVSSVLNSFRTLSHEHTLNSVLCRSCFTRPPCEVANFANPSGDSCFPWCTGASSATEGPSDSTHSRMLVGAGGGPLGGGRCRIWYEAPSGRSGRGAPHMRTKPASPRRSTSPPAGRVATKREKTGKSIGQRHQTCIPPPCPGVV
jgi:hypothetical protein